MICVHIYTLYNFSNFMMTSSSGDISALLALCAGNSPVTGEFPAQRPVTRSFDIFFGLRLNKRLSKQSCGWWFETPSCLLWRHRNGFSSHPSRINPLSLGKFSSISKCVSLKHFVMNDIWNSFCAIDLSQMPAGLIDDKSAMAQVMAWCRQATSHYLSQGCPRSMSPCDVMS